MEQQVKAKYSSEGLEEISLDANKRAYVSPSLMIYQFSAPAALMADSFGGGGDPDDTEPLGDP